MKEADLYLPIKQFLETQGYEVKGEVQGCDVLAVRGAEEPVVVELKLSLSLDVILQAVDRLALSSKVYVGVPRKCAALKRRRRPTIKLFKMLGLGLLVVDLRRKTGCVEVLVDPCEYSPRRSKHRQGRLLGEFVRRVGDPNLGGSETRRGIVTAYRQRAEAIGRFLRENGPTKASLIARSIDEPDARAILYRNVYGWFDRESAGVYGLSPRGERELGGAEPDAVAAGLIDSDPGRP